MAESCSNLTQMLLMGLVQCWNSTWNPWGPWQSSGLKLTLLSRWTLARWAITNIWWHRMSGFLMKGEVEWNTELPINGWKSFQFNTDALLMGLAWCWNSAWHHGPWKSSGLKLILLSCWTLAKIISPSPLPPIDEVIDNIAYLRHFSFFFLT